MRILATAFDPCADEPAPNPSQVVLDRLTPPHGAHLEKRTLPTVYGAAGDLLLAAIANTRPHLVLMTGVAYSITTPTVRIETTARNADTSPRPDNAGQTGRPIIIPDAPPTLHTTIPLDHVRAALGHAGIRYTISGDAGGYLCNHAYYLALHTISQESPPAACVFAHVGPGAEAIAEAVRACQTIMRVLAEHTPAATGGAR